MTKAGQKNCLRLVCLLAPGILSWASNASTVGCLLECAPWLHSSQHGFGCILVASWLEGFDAWAAEQRQGARGPDAVQLKPAFVSEPQKPFSLQTVACCEYFLYVRFGGDPFVDEWRMGETSCCL
jgi:hypothetical protein